MQSQMDFIILFVFVQPTSQHLNKGAVINDLKMVESRRVLLGPWNPFFFSLFLIKFWLSHVKEVFIMLICYL